MDCKPNIPHNSLRVPSDDTEEYPVGEGGYAKVSKRGTIAVKRIKWIHLESAVRELIFIKSCSHPCIIKINGISAEPENILLTMKYYPAVLTTYQIRGITDVISISYGLICACEYIHNMGIIHCDIKCDNILVEPGSAPKPVLCDFGISLRVEEQQHVGSVQTVTYRAPEVNFSSNSKLHDPKIDIWSVGAVIFRLISSTHMYKYISGCEDSTVYAAKFFGINGKNRKERLKKLYSIRNINVTETLLRKFSADTQALIYTCGLVPLLACSLHPNPNHRSTASTLADIMTKIIQKSFPEISHALNFRRAGRQPPSINVRCSRHSLDELRCVINVPIEVIGSCSCDCLNYAELIYGTYASKTGIVKLEISLACIYIASATYCDSNALYAILTVMDMEQVRKYVVQVLSEL
jgi:serine/threonine protein kinase